MNACCFSAPCVLAYIGPGAGFAFLGSFLILLTALGLVLVALLRWPFRLLAAPFLRPGRRPRRTPVRRVIAVGLDGLDPRRCERLMNAGRLPNLARLRSEGAFGPLATTCPPISPVAWSTFMTGANPGKHAIFDFLNRNLKTRVPELSSSRIDRPRRGRRPEPRLLRRSKPFWRVLGEYGIHSTVLRVPITFPPEPFRGLCLSGMCVPDLRGTQGSFTCFTDRPPSDAGAATGGCYVPVTFDRGQATAALPGPTLSGRELKAPLRIEWNAEAQTADVRINGSRLHLRAGEYSDWTRVTFRAGPFRRVHGICRLLLTRPAHDAFRLYVSPINIDPERPALPVSHPRVYSVYLAKLHGPFATLGLAEDTWARNEGVLDDDAFLDQVYAIHGERERMLLESIRRIRRGACVCVFDAPDRVQHMFTRDTQPETDATIDFMYERMDATVGRVLGHCGRQDVLFVLSDHGFSSFRRGVNLNAWLRDQGYLVTLPDRNDADNLGAVDWTRTRAYTFGLSGVYINLKGRECNGVVDQAERHGLKRELADKLRELRDSRDDRAAVREVYDTAEVYSGPYTNEGPDLVVGYEDGFRASWEAATGRVTESVFSDNTKPWSGDHCIDCTLVPGVLFCSRPIRADGPASLQDLAPTILDMLGVPVPAYMDGKPLQTGVSVQGSGVQEQA